MSGEAGFLSLVSKWITIRQALSIITCATYAPDMTSCKRFVDSLSRTLVSQITQELSIVKTTQHLSSDEKSRFFSVRHLPTGNWQGIFLFNHWWKCARIDEFVIVMIPCAHDSHKGHCWWIVPPSRHPLVLPALASERSASISAATTSSSTSSLATTSSYSSSTVLRVLKRTMGSRSWLLRHAGNFYYQKILFSPSSLRSISIHIFLSQP